MTSRTARAKQSLREKILAAQPNCIFCAGLAPSEELDHVPARGLFDMRYRPSGLEFGACRACNRGASDCEQIAQFLSRFEERPTSDLERREIDRIIGNSLRRHPWLAEELKERHYVGEIERFALNQYLPGGVPVRIGGPLITKHIQDFSSKLGLALHYQRTAIIVPVTGFIATAWYSNADAVMGKEPLPIGDFLTEPATLMQGQWEVSKQFRYASAWTADGNASMHRCVFRSVFAVDAIVAADSERFYRPPPSTAYRRPGFLRDLKLPPLHFRPRP